MPPFDNLARALSHRNYRVYISGNGISLIGTWLQRVSVGWLAWTLTHSGTWLGLVSLAAFLPVMFLSPLAGVMAERRDRGGVIPITQRIGRAQGHPRAGLGVASGGRRYWGWQVEPPVRPAAVNWTGG